MTEGAIGVGSGELSGHKPEAAANTVRIFIKPDITDFKFVIANARRKTKGSNLRFNLVNQTQTRRGAKLGLLREQMADAVVCERGAKRTKPRANSGIVNFEVSDVGSRRIAYRYYLSDGNCWHDVRCSNQYMTRASKSGL
ncbi:MAG: hypothetical protein ABSC24_11275 [Verrucomicrobiota bacterium]